MSTFSLSLLIVTIVVVVLALFEQGVSAFSTRQTFVFRRPHPASFSSSSLISSFTPAPTSPLCMGRGALEQQPHESNDAYMKRLLQVASDAATFEKAVLEEENTNDDVLSSSSVGRRGYQRQATSTTRDASNSSNKGVKKYQRGEDWDAQRTVNGTMTWEEKVQFDGQRHGNRFNQNEILRHHLHTY